MARKERDYDGIIRETPDVCGGFPCVGNTRIAVRLLVESYRTTGSVDDVAELFPQLTRTQIEDALAYYRDYPTRVDEDIARNARVWAELTARSWPD